MHASDVDIIMHSCHTLSVTVAIASCMDKTQAALKVMLSNLHIVTCGVWTYVAIATQKIICSHKLYFGIIA